MLNRREFGKTMLGVLGMYTLGTPKHAGASGNGESSYYFNEFNSDIFAPFAASGVTPSDILSRWYRFWDTRGSPNAFIEGSNLRINGQGEGLIHQYNGNNFELFDRVAGVLEIGTKFLVAGEPRSNVSDKVLDFGLNTGDDWIGYRIVPGDRPLIIFRDTADRAYQESPLELTAQNSYIARVRFDGQNLIASIKQDNGENQIIVEKPVSDFYGVIKISVDGGSETDKYDFRMDWILVKGSQVNPEGSDLLSPADINLDAEVDSIDAHLFADKVARGEANQQDLLVFIEEFQRRNPEDQETMAFLQSLRTSSVEDWQQYR